MVDEHALIRIVVVCDAAEYVLEAYPYSYPNLMVLILDKLYPPDFGECKGRGQCGTCHIHILDYPHEFEERSGNENNTLSKMASTRANSRLACQIMVNSKINGLRVKVTGDV